MTTTISPGPLSQGEAYARGMQLDKAQKYGVSLRPGTIFLRRPEQEHSHNAKLFTTLQA
jgi:hypothetical protein